MLSETPVAANSVSHDTVYNDHFVVESAIRVRDDGSIIIEQAVIQGYAGNVECVCASEESNTSDETIKGSIRPSEHAVAAIELRFGELPTNKIADFSHETGNKNDLSTV